MKKSRDDLENVKRLVDSTYNRWGNLLVLDVDKPYNPENSALGYCFKDIEPKTGRVIYKICCTKIGIPETDFRVMMHEYGHIYLAHMDGIYEELDIQICNVLRDNRGELIESINKSCGIDFADKLLERIIDDPTMNHSIHNIAMDMEVNSTVLSKEDVEEMERDITSVMPKTEEEILQYLIDNSEDPAKKEEYKKELDKMAKEAKIKLILPCRYNTGMDASGNPIPFPDDLTYVEYLILIFKHLDQFIKMLVSIDMGGNGDTSKVTANDIQKALNDYFNQKSQEYFEGYQKALEDLQNQQGQNGQIDQQYVQGYRDGFNQEMQNQQNQGQSQDQNQNGQSQSGSNQQGQNQGQQGNQSQNGQSQQGQGQNQQNSGQNQGQGQQSQGNQQGQNGQQNSQGQGQNGQQSQNQQNSGQQNQGNQNQSGGGGGQQQQNGNAPQMPSMPGSGNSSQTQPGQGNQNGGQGQNQNQGQQGQGSGQNQNGQGQGQGQSSYDKGFADGQQAARDMMNNQNQQNGQGNGQGQQQGQNQGNQGQNQNGQGQSGSNQQGQNGQGSGQNQQQGQGQGMSDFMQGYMDALQNAANGNMGNPNGNSMQGLNGLMQRTGMMPPNNKKGQAKGEGQAQVDGGSSPHDGKGSRQASGDSDLQKDHGSKSRQEADQKRKLGQIKAGGGIGCGSSGGPDNLREVDTMVDEVDMAIKEVIRHVRHRVLKYTDVKDTLRLYNRGIQRKVIVPSITQKISLSVDPKLVFLIDISGSMNTELVDRVLKTISKCLYKLNRGLRYDIITWSTRLGEHIKDIDPKKGIRRISCGGGTDMASGMVYFKNNYDSNAILILISDFEDSLNEWHKVEMGMKNYLMYGFNYGYHTYSQEWRYFHQKNFSNYGYD